MTWTSKPTTLVQWQGPDIDWAVDASKAEFEAAPSNEIRDWLDRRGIPVVLEAECVEIDGDKDAFALILEVALVFEHQVDAMAYELEFGGVAEGD